MVAPSRPGLGGGQEGRHHPLVVGGRGVEAVEHVGQAPHDLVVLVELEGGVDPDVVGRAQGQDGAAPAALLDRLAGLTPPSTRAMPAVL